jgi:hypothetical protein
MFGCLFPLKIMITVFFVKFVTSLIIYYLSILQVDVQIHKIYWFVIIISISEGKSTIK